MANGSYCTALAPGDKGTWEMPASASVCSCFGVGKEGGRGEGKGEEEG